MAEWAEQDNELSIEVVYLYRWWFILPASAVMAVVLCVSMLTPDKYTTEAYFDRRTDTFLAFVLDIKEQKLQFRSAKAMRAQITNDTAIKTLVVHLRMKQSDNGETGGEKKSIDLKTLRARLARHLTVHVDKLSPHQQRIRVGYLGEDRQFAHDVVNTLVQNYVKQTVSKPNPKVLRAKAFLEAQAKRSWDRYEKMAKQMLAIEMRYPYLLVRHVGYRPSSHYEIKKKLERLLAMQKRTTAHIADLKQISGYSPEYPLPVHKIGSDSNPLTTPGGATRPRQFSANPQDRKPRRVQADRVATNTSPLGGLRIQLAGSARSDEQRATTTHVTDRYPAIDATSDLGIMRNGRQRDEPIEKRPPLSEGSKKALRLQIVNAMARLHDLRNEINETRLQASLFYVERAEWINANKYYRKILIQLRDTKRRALTWSGRLRDAKKMLENEKSYGRVQLELAGSRDTVRDSKKPGLFWTVGCGSIAGYFAGCLGMSYARLRHRKAITAQELANELELDLMGSVGEIISDKRRRVRNASRCWMAPVKGVALIVFVGVTTALVYTGYDAFNVWMLSRTVPTATLLEHETERDSHRDDALLVEGPLDDPPVADKTYIQSLLHRRQVSRSNSDQSRGRLAALTAE